MIGRDHAWSGAVAFAAVAPLLHVNAVELAAGVIMGAGAGLIPDIDEPGSTIARQGGFLTRGLGWVVHHVSGGHRKGTHSLIGLAIFTYAAELAVTYQHSIYAQIGLGLFIALLGAAFFHAVERGGHIGDAIGVAAAGAVVYYHIDLTIVPLIILIGAAAHIAGDMCTHDGCPLLYPFSHHDYALLPHEIRITTGKFTETWVVTPVLLIALAYLLWRDATSLVPLNIHQLLTQHTSNNL